MKNKSCLDQYSYSFNDGVYHVKYDNNYKIQVFWIQFQLYQQKLQQITLKIDQQKMKTLIKRFYLNQSPLNQIIINNIIQWKKSLDLDQVLTLESSTCINDFDNCRNVFSTLLQSIQLSEFDDNSKIILQNHIKFCIIQS